MHTWAPLPPHAAVPFSRTRRRGSSRPRFGDRRGSVETEDGEQGGIDSPLLLRCQMAGEVTEAPEVGGTDLLDKHPSEGAIDVDLRPERRRLGARRRRGHQHDRPREEGVGLHYDAKARPALFVSHALGESQTEDVTAAHGDSP